MLYDMSQGKKHGLTSAQIVSRYLEAMGHGSWHRYALEDWSKWTRGTVSRLPSDHFERFRDWLEVNRHNGPRTIEIKVTHARRALLWAHDQGLIDYVPRKPKLARIAPRPRDVTVSHLRYLIERMPARLTDLVTFLVTTGARPGEGRLLEWREIDTDNGIIRIPPEKHKTGKRTGKDRVIYMTPGSRLALKSAGDRDGRTGYVFINQRGTPYTRCGLSSVLRRYGIAPYSLRHTFAQFALDKMPMEDVARLLGHSDLRTVQVYCQVRDRRAMSVAKRMENPLRSLG